MGNPSYSLQKHLEFIQNAITRHARTSFLLKGWAVTLVAAILFLTARNPDILDGAPISIALSALMPTFVFWGLDAFYLKQERMHRKLYEAAINGKVKEKFTLDARRYESEVKSWCRTLWAPTVIPIYLVVIGVVFFGSGLSNVLVEKLCAP